MQAISVDENRYWWPGTDVNVNKEKRKFRGVHADIGGGWANHEIADFVLQWMTDHAIKAGVSIDLTWVKERYGWHPNQYGPINTNDWYYPSRYGQRTFIGPTGTWMESRPEGRYNYGYDDQIAAIMGY